MRVYLPSTLPGLRALLDAGELGPPPLPAYGVTGALREWYAEGDEEELEYAALTLAARASVRLLDRALLLDPTVPPRRVVVVAEVDVVQPAPDVELAEPGVIAGLVSVQTRAGDPGDTGTMVSLLDLEALHVTRQMDMAA